jgi:LAO/AO transport system kinase
MPDSAALSDRHRALLADFRAGRRSALARIISIVEDERPGFQAVLDELHPDVGRATRLGITGPPGAGKSTLTSGLVAAYRARGERVAVVAVDPTSPFTGGALLGDRIRMQDVADDPGVFIRSMATRGSLGGLAASTREVLDVLDAFGFDRLLIETVGVGQSELEVAGTADSTVVVLVPESGDSVQAMKAGLMEISDLFVINKSDRPGADRLARELQLMLHLRSGDALRNLPAHHGVDLRKIASSTAISNSTMNSKSNSQADSDAPLAAEPWEIPVLQTVASTGQGTEAVIEALDRHMGWLEAGGELERRRRERLAVRVRDAVDRALRLEAWQRRGGATILAEALPALQDGTATPNEVAARIVRAVVG